MNATSPIGGVPAASAAAAVIEMIDVSIGLAGAVETAAVEGIHCAIAAGDYWVIGGPPGSGKTDLLATMAGLYRPLKGTLRLFGKHSAKLDEDDFRAARLRIGLVFDNGGRLFNHLTVAENIALPLRYHREGQSGPTEERVSRILEVTGLTALARDLAGQIKHGSRQRVGLARALALGPEILLLDNPLTGLGQRESRWWREFLARLAAGHELTGGQPVTLAITCDDLRPWADQGKQFALLRQKRWVRIGGRIELASSEEPYLRELLAPDFNVGLAGGS